MTQSRFEEWLSEHKISEVECLVADMNGTARGKILPPKKFLKGNKSRGLRIPEEVFTLTINGRYTQDTTRGQRQRHRHLHEARLGHHPLRAMVYRADRAGDLRCLPPR